jgi:hypothetical protein
MLRAVQTDRLLFGPVGPGAAKAEAAEFGRNRPEMLKTSFDIMLGFLALS